MELDGDGEHGASGQAAAPWSEHMHCMFSSWCCSLTHANTHARAHEHMQLLQLHVKPNTSNGALSSSVAFYLASIWERDNEIARQGGALANLPRGILKGRTSHSSFFESSRVTLDVRHHTAADCKAQQYFIKVHPEPASSRSKPLSAALCSGSSTAAAVALKFSVTSCLRCI